MLTKISKFLNGLLILSNKKKKKLFKNLSFVKLRVMFKNPDPHQNEMYPTLYNIYSPCYTVVWLCKVYEDDANTEEKEKDNLTENIKYWISFSK